jgi:hypothetical protein
MAPHSGFHIRGVDYALGVSAKFHKFSKGSFAQNCPEILVSERALLKGLKIDFIAGNLLFPRIKSCIIVSAKHEYFTSALDLPVPLIYHAGVHRAPRLPPQRFEYASQGKIVLFR